MTIKRTIALALAATVLSSGATAKPAASPVAKLPRVATVSDRYLSYNIEMVEVTGGRFWAPFGGPPGERYRMRAAVNLASPKLRGLARALAPSYIRVSGTWANSSYLPAEGEQVTTPPPGFKQVLTRDQWRGVVAFSRLAGAKIVTSFPASTGARNADGSWNPEQAQRLLDLTRASGGSIYGAELFNEPTMPEHGEFPKGYSAADFGRDFRIFQAWARKAAPTLKLTGPGGTAEGTMLKAGTGNGGVATLHSEDLMRQNPGSLDIVSYHHYGTVSLRCGPMKFGAKDKGLDPEFLALTATDYDYYAALRDKFEPRKPLWLNETAQAACGGSPWAASFLDTFRFLNQLGVLAQKGVQVVAHNTLDASDYGLIDQDTGVPRPNYWASVLWKRTMGTRVLATPASPSPELRLFAHCLPAGKGGVGVLAINIGTASHSLRLGKGMAWSMTGSPLDTKNVRINGAAPHADDFGTLRELGGVRVNGSLAVAGQSIAFVSLPNAGNAACR